MTATLWYICISIAFVLGLMIGYRRGQKDYEQSQRNPFGDW